MSSSIENANRRESDAVVKIMILHFLPMMPRTDEGQARFSVPRANWLGHLRPRILELDILPGVHVVLVRWDSLGLREGV